MIFVGLKAAYIDLDMRQGGLGQKFIVARYKTDSPRLHLFQYFAVNLYTSEDPEHRLIAQGFKVDPELVLGGGRAKLSGDRVILHSISQRFGGVPKRFLDLHSMQLLHDYQQHYPNIKEISIEVPSKSGNDSRVTFLDQLMAG
jgi:hypothetical protein